MKVDPAKHLVDGKYSIKDLVNLKELRALFQSFTDSMGFTVGFLNVPELEILIATGWRDICTKYHRRCPLAAIRCRESNDRLIRHLKRPSQIVIEACENGLVDCATPIIIKGKKIAILATGQVFLKPPNLEYFKKQAKLFGCNETAYLRAVKEVPVISGKKLKQATHFLGELALTIVRMGSSNLGEKERAERLGLEIQRRKKIENNLREVMSQKGALFGALNDGILVAERRTKRILQVNGEACRMFGYSRAEFLKKRVPDLHPAKNLHSVMSDFEELLQKKKHLVSDEPCLKKGGAVFFADIAANPAMLGGEKCLVGFFRDATERKALNNVLEEKKHVLSEAQRIAHIGSWRYDPTNGLSWEDETYNIYGVSPKNFTPSVKSLISVIHPDDQSAMQAWIKACWAGKKPDEFQFRVVDPDKTIRFLSGRGELRYDAKNKPDYMAGTVQDITARKKSEENLKHALSLERATLESTTDGILVVDAKTRKVADFNKRFGQMWKIPERILLKRDDRSLLKYVLPQLKDPKSFLSKVADLYQYPEKDSYDALLFKDGKVFERYSHPQLVDGRAVGRVWSFRDITQREKSATLLRESEAKYRTIFESSHDAMMTLEPPSWRFTSANRSMVRMFKAKNAVDLYSHSPWALSPKRQPDGRSSVEKVREMIRTAMRKGSHFFEWTHRRIDGVAFPADVLLTRLEREGKTLLQATVRDITERKRIEGEILRTKVQYQQLVENAKDGIFTVDLKGRFLLTNPEFRTMVGYRRKEMERLTILDTYPEDFRKDGEERMKLLRDGETLRFERPMKRKDGSLFVAEAVAWRTPEGQIQAFIRDVTERKQVEKLRLEHQRQLWQVIDMVPHMIFAKDRHGRFLFLNRATAEAYQKQPKDLIGVPRQDVHKDRHEMDEFLRTDREVLASGKPLLIPNETFTNGQGNRRIQNTIKIPFTMIGMDEMAVLGVSVDVTEQRKVEEFRNDIVRTISHELRTPLSIEKEGVSLLLDEIVGPVSAEQKEILGMVMRSIDRLSRMITSLLDISRIEVGKIQLVQQITDLADLVKDVAFEFKGRAGEKDVDLNVKLPGHAVEVFADPDKIIQVLSNLVDNAIKFTPQGGVVEIALVVRKDEVECEVRDNGVGISQENIDGAFEKFTQFSKTVGAGEKGLGLGLAIAKGIIEMHKGRIWIKSELGKGTQVVFSLPLYQKSGD